MGSMKQLAKYLSLITYLGVMMVCCVLVGYYLGFYLDKYMSTNMVFTIIGVLFGSFSGLYMLYKISVKSINKQ